MSKRNLAIISIGITALAIFISFGIFFATRSSENANSSQNEAQRQAESKDLPELTQEYIDEHVAKLLALEANWNLEEPADFAEMNPDQQLYILRGNDNLSPDYTEKSIMLASVSKIAVNIALVRALERAEKLDIKATLDYKALVELFERRPGRFIDKEIYAQLLTDNPEVRDIATQAAAADPKDEIALGTLREQFLLAIPGNIQYEISLEELLYLALSLSSNTANDISKIVAAESGASMDAELAEIVPNYTSSPVLTTAMEHWLVPLPNVGPLSEHVDLLHELGQKLQSGTLSSGEELIIHDLINNPNDYDFDFTHSTVGKRLIARGYRVMEKTGYYPAVFWVNGFTSVPFEYPTHMVLATAVSIVPPEDSKAEVVSFGYNQLYAVKLPKTLNKFVVNGVELTFPDVLPDYAKETSNPVKEIVNPLFRSKLEEELKKLYP